MIEKAKITNALKKILDVERDHVYGARTGSDTARRNELQKVIGKIVEELRPQKADKRKE